MLNCRKKNCALRDKKNKYSNSNPPPCKLNGWSLSEQRFYCCSTFHSHSSILNNEQNSYDKMVVKQPISLQV